MSDRAAVSEREEKVLKIIETARGKKAKFKDPAITMAHGAGGKATQTLIEGLFVPAFGSDAGAVMGDAGAVGGDLAMTTDSFVVSPLRGSPASRSSPATPRSSSAATPTGCS